MRTVFVDANETLAAVARRLNGPAALDLIVNEQPDILPQQIADVAGDAEVLWIDHTQLPLDVARACSRLKHVVFLGTGARSYMDPEKLAAIGITVHTISGYGDTAVAEMTVALMWAAAKSLGRMDREMHARQWIRRDGLQLSGRTLGLVGFGGIAREVARLTTPFMRVLAWNRTPKQCEGVEFVELDRLLRESDVVSVHLLLNDETRGFLSAERIALMKPGAMLVNTARGALLDEAALIARLRSGALAHAALDVYAEEPLPAAHPLRALENVTLSAHSAFRTAEASETLIARAIDIVRSFTAE